MTQREVITECPGYRYGLDVYFPKAGAWKPGGSTTAHLEYDQAGGGGSTTVYLWRGKSGSISYASRHGSLDIAFASVTPSNRTEPPGEGLVQL